MPDAPDPPPKRRSANAVVAPDPDAQILTFGEVAHVLRVSLSTVRRVVGEGQIRSMRVLGRNLITRAALDDFIRGADLAKKPTSEVAAELAAQKKIEAEQRRRVRVVADWNKGEDLIDLEGYKARQAQRAARKKAKSSA